MHAIEVDERSVIHKPLDGPDYAVPGVKFPQASFRTGDSFGFQNWAARHDDVPTVLFERDDFDRESAFQTDERIPVSRRMQIDLRSRQKGGDLRLTQLDTKTFRKPLGDATKDALSKRLHLLQQRCTRVVSTMDRRRPQS